MNMLKTDNSFKKINHLFFLFFGKSSNAVEWSCFFKSLNKMTNAAYENAMRRCPRN